MSRSMKMIGIPLHQGRNELNGSETSLSGLRTPTYPHKLLYAHCPHSFQTSTPSIQTYTLLRNQLFHPFHKLSCRHRAFRLLLAADAHVHRAGLGLFFANHQNERDFLQRVFAHLGVHLFVAIIEMDAYAGLLQLLRDLSAIVD